jgi:hypothetical protein
LNALQPAAAILALLLIVRFPTSFSSFNMIFFSLFHARFYFVRNAKFGRVVESPAHSENDSEQILLPRILVPVKLRHDIDEGLVSSSGVRVQLNDSSGLDY